MREVYQTRVLCAGARKFTVVSGFAGHNNLQQVLQYLMKVKYDSRTSLEALQHAVEHLVAVKSYYLSAAQSQHDPMIIRALVDWIKFAIEIYHPDGSRVIYPHKYQINEPSLQLYYDSDGYRPIIKIEASGCVSTEPLKQIRIGTWNTQGGAGAARQQAIDHHCREFGLDVVCLQDVRTQVIRLSSEHYFWCTSYTGDSRERISGFLILKTLACEIRPQVLTSGLQILKLQFEQHEMILINAYLPCDGQDDAFESYAALRKLILEVREDYPDVLCMVCGDYNAHMGHDIVDPDAGLTGPYLYHQVSNENGSYLWEMMQFHQLRSCSTIQSSSTLITREQGGIKSQLDHVLVPKEFAHLITNMNGSWRDLSDHKMQFMSVRVPLTKTVSDIETHRPHHFMQRRPRYQLNLLQHLSMRRAYDQDLTELCEDKQLERKVRQDINDAWSEFVEAVHTVARRRLLAPSKRNPEQKKAHRRHQAAVNLLHHPRVVDQNCLYDSLSDYPRRDPDIVRLIGMTRRQERQIQVAQDRDAIHRQLDEIETSTPVHIKTNLTFKMLRQLRRQNQQQAVTAVPFSTLNSELQALDHGKVPQLRPDEHDYFPAPRPPSEAAVQTIIAGLRGGTAPGLDHIFNELVIASKTIQFYFALFITVVYESNRVPDAWRRTAIFLLPKIPRPLSIDDYRPITLCLVIYKIYARRLSDEMHEFLPKLPGYQSGFLPNRSADDSIFTLNRVIETHWNHGQTLYVVTIDLRKAFSMVNIHMLPKILATFGVPSYLIERINEAVLYEETCIKYMGQETPFYVKTLGVKQGCPISPELFVWILHFAVLRLQETLEGLPKPVKLNIGDEKDELTLPMITGYADDLTLVFRNVRTMRIVIPALQEALGSCGLSVNANKSAVLIKSGRHRTQNTLGKTMKLGSLEIPVKKSVIILGSKLNHDMSRRGMIYDRCAKAMRLYHAMIGMLKSRKLPFEVLVRLYRVALVPVMLYGLRSIAFTQEQKKMLMRREIQMLQGFARISHPRPRAVSIQALLKGHTINRVLTVGRICYHSHLQRRSVNSLLRRAQRYNLNGTRRKLGRPCYTFPYFVEKELKELGPVIRDCEWGPAFVSAHLTKKLCAKVYAAKRVAIDPLPANYPLFLGRQG